MHIGYIVGIIVAVAFVITGSVAAVHAKKNHKRNRWAKGLILFGVLALISAVINYNLFSAG